MAWIDLLKAKPRPAATLPIDVGRTTVTVLFDDGRQVTREFQGRLIRFMHEYLPHHANDLAKEWINESSPIKIDGADGVRYPRHRVRTYTVKYEPLMEEV